MKLTSYWLDTALPPFAASREPVAGGADVAAIGAGVSRAPPMLPLAKAGVRHVICAWRPLQDRPH